MINIFFIFILLLVSVWFGVHLQQDPGYVLIALHHWTLETTLWVGLGIIVLLFVFLHLVLLSLSWLGQLPYSWSSWRAKRRAHLAQTKTRQGLIEFSEGHWLRAKNCLIKALPDADTPLLNYLTAARAAQEMGEYQMRDNFLREAQQCMPEAKIAVELTQAQLQLANRQWEQALATLRHLRDIAPNHPYVLKLLVELYQEVKDWQQVIALLPDLKRYRVIASESFEQLQHDAYIQVLSELIKQDQVDAVNAFYAELSRTLKDDPKMVFILCRYFLEKGEIVQAEERLRRCLRQTFDESLIDLYGQISTPGVARLNFIESLLNKHPHSSAIYLCLGRLCQSNQLWGKAKSYIEESLRLSATPVAYKELGELLEQLGDETGAFRAYRQGLLLAVKE